jgi:uncharacterized protein (UPF0303 family)
VKSYDELVQEERKLAEAPWDQVNTVALGETLRRIAEDQNLSVAIAVFFKSQRIYQVGLPGTAVLNDEWIMRKVHSVEMTKHSSLALRAKADALGIQEEEFGFNSGHLAICGGGYPLLTNGELVGIAITSGLPHEADHNLIIEALTEFRKEITW